MDKELDEELIEAINRHADRATDARPKLMDRSALAEALYNDFNHRSFEEIEEKLDDVWRTRGLFFAEAHR